MDQAWLAAQQSNDTAFYQYIDANPDATQDQLAEWIAAHPGPGPVPNEATHAAYYNMVNGLPPPAPPPPPPGPPVPEPPDEGEIRYTDLVPGQRYVINAIGPDDGQDFDDLPYEGTYASFENYGGLYAVKFTGVTNRNGELIHHEEVPGNENFLVDQYKFSILGGPLQPNIPPKPWPQRNIPAGTVDVVNQMEIEEGMDMVDFHGESGFGRYYPLEVYSALQLPKRNPMTRQPILNADLQYYTAHIVPTGARRLRRQTKKSKRQRQRGGIPPPGGEPRLTIAIPRPQVPGPRAESGAQAPRPRGGRKTRRSRK